MESGLDRLIGSLDDHILSQQRIQAQAGVLLTVAERVLLGLSAGVLLALIAYYQFIGRGESAGVVQNFYDRNFGSRSNSPYVSGDVSFSPASEAEISAMTPTEIDAIAKNFAEGQSFTDVAPTAGAPGGPGWDFDPDEDPTWEQRARKMVEDAMNKPKNGYDNYQSPHPPRYSMSPAQRASLNARAQELIINANAPATPSFLASLQAHPAIALAIAGATVAGLTLGSVLSPEDLDSIAPMVNEYLENIDPDENPNDPSGDPVPIPYDPSDDPFPDTNPNYPSDDPGFVDVLFGPRVAETNEAGWQGKDLVWDDELKTYKPRVNTTPGPFATVGGTNAPIGFSSKTGDTAYLSNFASSAMTGLDGNVYKTAEHAFQASKTTDPIWRQRIIDAPTAAAARALGRQAPLRDDWAEIRMPLMKRILEAKFEQNPTLASQLMATEDRSLQHTADWDNFWGMGSSGTGANVLGKLLMELRAELIMANRNAPEVTPPYIKELEENQVFVFGSNTEGRHGLGAAKTAMGFGAEYGKAEGMQGSTYAIPTKDLGSGTLSIEEIETAIKRFIAFANNHSRLTFLVTPIGTGLAGFSAEEIAPFFVGAPSNVVLPAAFQPTGETIGDRSTIVPAKNATTTVINIRGGGSADVYIGQGSKWGNPFVIGKDGNREEVIEKYEQYLLGRQDLLDALGELKGKVLGCYCAPQACHGDVLARYADNM